MKKTSNFTIKTAKVNELTDPINENKTTSFTTVRSIPLFLLLWKGISTTLSVSRGDKNQNEVQFSRFSLGF